jgi:hypothetical protein
MTVGNLQILYSGQEDLFLTGNPQKTFFKNTYKRHTKFSIITREARNDGEAKFGNKAHFKIDKEGDLLKNIYLQLKVKGLQQEQEGSTYVGYVNSFLPSIIEYVDIMFNSQKIDRIYGTQLDIYNELYNNEGMRKTDDIMIGKYQSNVSLQTNALDIMSVFQIRLPFWFTKEAGLSIPLISLQYTDISIHVKFRDRLSSVVSDVQLTNVLDYEGNTFDIDECSIFSDYIILDKEERKIFSSKTHDYLIQQHQYNEDFVDQTTNNFNMNLSFEKPVSYLVWVIQDKPRTNTNFDLSGANKWVRYCNNTQTDSPLNTAEIKLNGLVYEEEKDYRHYLFINSKKFKNSPRKYIYSVLFSLNPTDWSPSGHLNFSRFDKKELILKLNQHSYDKKIMVFASNYNILRIKSGLAGLAFV